MTFLDSITQQLQSVIEWNQPLIKLTQLKNMLESYLTTEQEYATKKQDILDQM